MISTSWSRLWTTARELRKLVDDSFSGIHVLLSDEDDNFMIGNSSLVSSNFYKDGEVADIWEL